MWGLKLSAHSLSGIKEWGAWPASNFIYHAPKFPGQSQICSPQIPYFYPIASPGWARLRITQVFVFNQAVEGVVLGTSTAESSLARHPLPSVMRKVKGQRQIQLIKRAELLS